MPKVWKEEESLLSQQLKVNKNTGMRWKYFFFYCVNCTNKSAVHFKKYSRNQLCRERNNS